MEDILIDKVGKIITGDDAGMYLKVLDDTNSTGGFLIIISKERNMKSGFDSWVEDRESIKKFFQESNWTVEWDK